MIGKEDIDHVTKTLSFQVYLQIACMWGDAYSHWLHLFYWHRMIWAVDIAVTTTIIMNKCARKAQGMLSS